MEIRKIEFHRQIAHHFFLRNNLRNARDTRKKKHKKYPTRENFLLHLKHSSTLLSFNFFSKDSKDRTNLIPRKKNLSFSRSSSIPQERKGARSCEISERVKSSATRRQRVRMESKGKWFCRVHELAKTTPRPPPLFLAVIGRLTCRLSARVPQDRLL